jgi:LysM domain
MPFPSYRPFSSPEDSRSARRSDESHNRERERLIPFPARPTSETESRARQVRRHRPEPRDGERSTTPRRPRRRRHSTPWLQRHALSLAALSFLAALLGLGFGVVQMLSRPEPTAALLPISSTEQSTVLVAASVGPPVALSLSTALPVAREIQASARLIEANYTVQAGDTLGRIASQYNTTVERIQAFNNITDARALRIGARLVIPPPL